MGTNYYLHERVCDKCGHAERELHVGKSSMGWTFSFRGYPHESDEPRVRSYADWLAYLEAALAAGGVLKNEYGEAVSLDDFRALVEAKRSAPNNHTTYTRDKSAAGDQFAGHFARDSWLDGEGHSFTGTEFS